MRKEMFLLSFGALALWSFGTAKAQQTGHQMASGSSAGGGAGVCGEHSQQGLQVIEAANRRLEESRQSNNPTKIRAALDQLQGALGQLKTHLSLCAAAVSSEPMDKGMQGMDPSKMGQEKPPAPKSEKPPSAQMDHSKMGQSKMDEPKMDHSKMGQGKPTASSAAPAKDPVDPICFKNVDTQGAEKATYQGKTYYFCSRADREKFLSDPAAYVKR